VSAGRAGALKSGLLFFLVVCAGQGGFFGGWLLGRRGM